MPVGRAKPGAGGDDHPGWVGWGHSSTPTFTSGRPLLASPPYSNGVAGIGQPAFPWRGRITCSPAAGYTGSVDQTAAAAAQVTAFFGDAEPTDFAVSGESVDWTGPPGEWGLRRMILHYAHLCDAAGGVDAFLIGSEMRGITQVRSGAATYPAVQALRGYRLLDHYEFVALSLQGHPYDGRDDDSGKAGAGDNGSEPHSPLDWLGQQITEGRPQRAGEDVDQPEGQDGVELQPGVSDREGCEDESKEDSGRKIAEAEASGDQVPDSGAEREGEEDCQPVERFAPGRSAF